MVAVTSSKETSSPAARRSAVAVLAVVACEAAEVDLVPVDVTRASVSDGEKRRKLRS